MQTLQKYHQKLLFPLFFLIHAMASCPPRYIQPPVAKIQPKVTIIHGDTLIDNYFWLRDRSNPEVIKYLEQ